MLENFDLHLVRPFHDEPSINLKKLMVILVDRNGNELTNMNAPTHPHYRRAMEVQSHDDSQPAELMARGALRAS